MEDITRNIFTSPFHTDEAQAQGVNIKYDDDDETMITAISLEEIPFGVQAFDSLNGWKLEKHIFFYHGYWWEEDWQNNHTYWTMKQWKVEELKDGSLSEEYIEVECIGCPNNPLRIYRDTPPIPRY